MSMNEMESIIRELRQLQALIDEAQQEAEAIKDHIKASTAVRASVVSGLLTTISPVVQRGEVFS